MGGCKRLQTGVDTANSQKYMKRTTAGPQHRTVANTGKGVLGTTPVCQRRCFKFGEFLMCVSFILFAASFGSSEWVRRHYYVPHMTTRVVSTSTTHWEIACYGAWRVCDTTGRCYMVTRLNNIKIGAILAAQLLMSLALLGYCLSLFIEAVSYLNLFASLGANRTPEFFFAMSAVAHFMVLVVFTSEIKNRAERAQAAVDVVDWAFIVSLTGALCAVLTVCIMAFFRPMPDRRKRRRFWKLPEELQPQPLLQALNVAVSEHSTTKTTHPIRISVPHRAP